MASRSSLAATLSVLAITARSAFSTPVFALAAAWSEPLVVRCRPLEGIGKPGETAGQGPRHGTSLAAEQEPCRGQEVLVVVLLIDLGVGRVELVRRCREKERGNGAAVMRLRLEQGLSELSGWTAAVFPSLDQWLESLEFVQNDQIRLQGADADLRQQPPQFAD